MYRSRVLAVDRARRRQKRYSFPYPASYGIVLYKFQGHVLISHHIFRKNRLAVGHYKRGVFR